MKTSQQRVGKHTAISPTMAYSAYTMRARNEEDDYTCKTASNVKEATDLVEHGFEYITEIDGVRLFRKRK